MPQVTSGTVYVDQALSDISIRYSNPQYIANDVFPVLNVPKETGFVGKFDKENLRAPQTSLRGDYARSERIDYGVSMVAYGPLLEHSIEVPLSKRLMANYEDPFEPRRNATNTATEKILIEKEIGLAAFLSSSANLVSGNYATLSGTSQWDNAASTPITAIQSAKTVVQSKTTKKPNVLVLGQQVFDGLLNNAQIIPRLQYNQVAGNANVGDVLASLFGVEKVLVGSAVANTAAEGQADSLGFIWGKNAYLMYVDPNPGIETVSAGYHLTLTGGQYVDTWEEGNIKTEFVRANDFYTRWVMAAECIYAFYAAVS